MMSVQSFREYVNLKIYGSKSAILNTFRLLKAIVSLIALGTLILYHGYPIMAMTRLSTRESDGKANLHQGAVGLVSILLLDAHSRPCSMASQWQIILIQVRIYPNLACLTGNCC